MSTQNAGTAALGEIPLKKIQVEINSYIFSLTLSGLSSEINIRPGGGGSIAPLEYVLIWPT